MAKKEPLYPHVPRGKSTVVDPVQEMYAVLVGLHTVIGEMLIDNDIDLSKYSGIQALHDRAYKAILNYKERR